MAVVALVALVVAPAVALLNVASIRAVAGWFGVAVATTRAGVALSPVCSSGIQWREPVVDPRVIAVYMCVCM